MANIEVEIESGKILERIWANTLGYPFMVQYFGRRLFEQIANSSLKKIDLHNVKEIEDDDETLSFLFTHFLYNTQDESGNQSSAERQCCALLANSVLLPIDDSAVTEQQIQFDPSFEGWTDMDFHTKSLSIGHPLNHLEIDEAIRNLCNAAILMRRQGKYHFALPLLPKVLKQRYPDLNSFVDSLY